MALYVLVFSALPNYAQAKGSAQDAEKFFKTYKNKAVFELQDKSLSETEIKKRFIKLYRNGFANQHLARFILGRYWNKASPQQRKDFTVAFEKYVIQSYALTFQSLSGYLADIKAIERQPNDYQITSTLMWDNGDQIPVEWRVKFNDERYWIYDILTQGVSLAVTYRSEFSTALRNNNGNIDQFIAILRTKTQTMTAE